MSPLMSATFVKVNTWGLANSKRLNAAAVVISGMSPSLILSATLCPSKSALTLLPFTKEHRSKSEKRNDRVSKYLLG